jgi:RNA polymerase sigma-70 factor, ECF subfamily
MVAASREDTARHDAEASHRQNPAHSKQKVRDPAVVRPAAAHADVGQAVDVGHLPSMTNALVHKEAAVEAIVRSAAAGDELAFARLVAEHHASMARVAFVICGDADMTVDAVQSAWAIAWQRIGTLRDPAQVRAWLVAVAANEARQAVRRRRRAPVVDVSSELTHRDESDPAESLTLVDLQRVLRGLSAEDRSLLAMRFAAGLDSTAIAKQLGLSASGVRSRLSRLLERLRADLALEPEVER